MDSSVQNDSSRGQHFTGRTKRYQYLLTLVLKVALYFPDIVGKTLDEGRLAHTTHLCQGNVSVISMLSTKMSEVR